MSLSAWTQANSCSLDLSSTSRRLTRSKSGLRVIALNTRQEPIWTLQEPQWMPDSQASVCPSCQQPFDLLRRRHHCRRCGGVFCGSCSSQRLSLFRMNFVDPVRHCHSCGHLTKKETLFFETKLKLLFQGCHIHIVHLQRTCHLKLSHDERFLVIVNNESSDHPKRALDNFKDRRCEELFILVHLNRISAIRTHEEGATTTMTIETNAKSNDIAIHDDHGHDQSGRESVKVQLVVKNDDNGKANVAKQFLQALQEAMNMVLNNHNV